MPLDALVKQGDEWVLLADMEHEGISTAQDNGQDYAVFEGAAQHATAAQACLHPRKP